MRIVTQILVCTLVTISVINSVHAQSEQAAAAIDEQARAYFRAGVFELAGEEFLKAYKVEKRPSRLFNAALAFEKANDRRRASTLFDKYLAAETDTTDAKVIEARARKAALDQSIAADLAAEEARVQEEAAKAQEEAAKSEHALAAGQQRALSIDSETQSQEPAPEAEMLTQTIVMKRPWSVATPYLILVSGGLLVGAGYYFQSASVRRLDDCGGRNQCDKESIDSSKREEFAGGGLYVTGGLVAFTGLIMIFRNGAEPVTTPLQQDLSLATGRFSVVPHSGLGTGALASWSTPF